ncbi:MAG: hypothetical protein B7X02_02910 [Rhodospirillales bacterium 12-54-5]|nr:MAG: hypothetical protein B7X02_02910 [Rhodospirillales bacterium 12-54-5]
MAASRTESIALPPQLNSESIGTLHQSLVETLRSKTKITLDASAVERLTTPYVQLLLGCLQRPGSATQILNASSLMRAAWAEFGLTHTHPLE